MCSEGARESMGNGSPPLHSQHRALQGFQLFHVEETLLLWQYQRQEAPQSWRGCVCQGIEHGREVVAKGWGNIY